MPQTLPAPKSRDTLRLSGIQELIPGQSLLWPENIFDSMDRLRFVAPESGRDPKTRLPVRYFVDFGCVVEHIFCDGQAHKFRPAPEGSKASPMGHPLADSYLSQAGEAIPGPPPPPTEDDILRAQREAAMEIASKSSSPLVGMDGVTAPPKPPEVPVMVDFGSELERLSAFQAKMERDKSRGRALVPDISWLGELAEREMAAEEKAVKVREAKELEKAKAEALIQFEKDKGLEAEIMERARALAREEIEGQNEAAETLLHAPADSAPAETENASTEEVEPEVEPEVENDPAAVFRAASKSTGRKARKSEENKD